MHLSHFPVATSVPNCRHWLRTSTHDHTLSPSLQTFPSSTALVRMTSRERQMETWGMGVALPEHSIMGWTYFCYRKTTAEARWVFQVTNLWLEKRSSNRRTSQCCVSREQDLLLLPGSVGWIIMQILYLKEPGRAHNQTELRNHSSVWTLVWTSKNLH